MCIRLLQIFTEYGSGFESQPHNTYAACHQWLLPYMPSVLHTCYLQKHATLCIFDTVSHLCSHAHGQSVIQSEINPYRNNDCGAIWCYRREVGMRSVVSGRVRYGVAFRICEMIAIIKVTRCHGSFYSNRGLGYIYLKVIIRPQLANQIYILSTCWVIFRKIYFRILYVSFFLIWT
jgi:hypothetical protein